MMGSNWDPSYALFMLRHVYYSETYPIMFGFNNFSPKPKIPQEKMNKNMYLCQMGKQGPDAACFCSRSFEEFNSLLHSFILYFLSLSLL